MAIPEITRSSASEMGNAEGAEDAEKGIPPELCVLSALCTANAGSLRVLTENLRPGSFEATHLDCPHNGDSQPPSRRHSLRRPGSEICANLCTNSPFWSSLAQGRICTQISQICTDLILNQ